MNPIHIIITILVTAVSLIIISKIPIGVEVDSFGKAVISAIVFGILNVIIRPILATLALPLTFLTFGLFSIVVNGIIFGLAAWLVPGFRLRWGIWSALLGALALSFVNSILNEILSKVLP